MRQKMFLRNIVFSDFFLFFFFSLTDSTSLSLHFFSEIEPCSMHPCSNEGTCHNLPGGSYKCTCNSGWSGEHCEVGKYKY